MTLREILEPKEHRGRLFGADDGARDDRRSGAKAEADEAAAAEALELVPVAVQLADPFDALRGTHRPARSCLSRRSAFSWQARTAPMRFMKAPRNGRWKMKVFGEPAQLALVGMCVAQGGLEHRAVVGERARVVGHDEAAPLGGDMSDAPTVSTRK